MTFYRQADARFPFLWEVADQPAGRWHSAGQGPVQYLADSPDGAWAEFIRHEGITDDADLVNVRRALWIIDVSDSVKGFKPDLPVAVLTGGAGTYTECREHAATLRTNGISALIAPSAALLPDGVWEWKVDRGVKIANKRDGSVLVLFGSQPRLIGRLAAVAARPRGDLLRRVRHLT